MKSCHFWAHILESGFGIVWGGVEVWVPRREELVFGYEL